MILSTAWKNVWRNKRRSRVVIASVAIGLIGGIFMSAMSVGMVEQRVQAIINNQLSHVQIHHPDFEANNEPQYNITNTDSIVTTLKSLPHVTGVSARLKIMAMAATANAATGVLVNGINPDNEKQVTTVFKKIDDSLSLRTKNETMPDSTIAAFVRDSCGTYFTQDKKNQIVIGRKLAEKLKLKVRSKVILTLQHADGSMTNGAFRVAGIYKTTNSMFDEMQVFVKQTELADLTGYDTNTSHEIALYLNGLQFADSVAQQIKKLYPHLHVQTWKEIDTATAMQSDMMDFMLYIIIIIILFALAFGIVNTMLMAVLERTRELGMLMAIGMNRSRIFLMIMSESVMLTFTGGFVGMLMSSLIVSYTGYTGINLAKFAQGMEAMGYDAVLYPSIGLDFYLGISILVVITGLLAAIYPAFKALKLRPVEAIRAE